MSDRVTALLMAWGVAALAFAALGEWLAGRKNRDGNEGFLLGLAFGPFGTLVEACLPNGPARGALRHHRRATAHRPVKRAGGEG